MNKKCKKGKKKLTQEVNFTKDLIVLLTMIVNLIIAVINLIIILVKA